MPKTILITDSQFAGTYLVYDLDHETCPYKVHEIEKNTLYEVGEYIRSFDNYAVPIVGKKEYGGMYKYWLALGIMIGKKGKYGIYNSKFNALFNPMYRDEMVTLNNVGNVVDRIKVSKMRLVAKGVLGGIPIQDLIRGLRIRRKVRAEDIQQILSSEEFMTEYCAEIDDFKEKLKSNPNFSDEMMQNEIASLLANSRKGTEAHRENIKFILGITGRYSDSSLSSKEIKAMKRSSMISSGPPLLGS